MLCHIYTLQRLANSYPSHGFVIDREEAKELFENVRIPTEREHELLNLLAHVSKIPNQEQTYFIYLSNSLKEKLNEGNNKENDPEGSKNSGESIPGVEVSDGEEGPSGSQNSKLRTILGKRKSKPQ